MTDKEQEILSLYLKDLRKKRIIIVLIVACIIIIGGASIRKYVLSNNENVMLNENVTNENTTNEIENTIKTENIIEKTEESENSFSLLYMHHDTGLLNTRLPERYKRKSQAVKELPGQPIPCRDLIIPQ